MSKQATEFQKKEMSKMYRGKEIFKPLNTGWVDEHVACVREWVANIFFYRKGETTIMVDAGYNYDCLEEKMGWLGIDPKSIRHILITHQDTDHVGADGGYSFISALAESNKLAVKSLAELEQKLRTRGLWPVILTGHTGWTDDLYFAFAHRDKLCSPFKKKVHDPSAPYDAYDESDDTEENARCGFLPPVQKI